MGEQLQAHREETAASYKIQLAATKNAEQLTSALENLTSITQEELRQINNTTHSIRENLLTPQGQGARVWYSILLNVFRVIGRGMSYCVRYLRCLIRRLPGDLPSYHRVSENFIFRIAITAGHMAWSLTWFFLSAMMVIISSELVPVLTWLPEHVVTPVEVSTLQAREVLPTHKPTAPL